ncbi:MAG: citrate synthase [Acidobacteriota bacterium]|nr:citrate synthase [Acidobacteriota bacterium]MDH3530461.1 citrate synthase [Acidobacteriota bacterium]
MSTGNESTASGSSAGTGLRGVVAAQSSMSKVNGEEGILVYQGFDIHDLAENSTFEETIYLLWNGRLPTRDELDVLKAEIRNNYAIPSEILVFMRHFPHDASPMDVLRTCVSTLAFYDKEGQKTDSESAKLASVKLTAAFPTIVAAWERIRNGKEPVAPDPTLDIAENFLYMMRGEKPDPGEARMLDICLILHADHGLNASTFACRVIAGTLADTYGAVTGGIAALAGPLHGGANTAVMKSLKEIGEVENVESWLEDTLSNKRKVMGVGHAVYKTEDPRATWLRKFSEQMGGITGETKWFEMSQKLEKLVKEKKGLNPNVDFYSASTYYMMGIPMDLFTPIFAISRISGWTGHILEQYAENKLIRPRAEYVGKFDQKWVPLDQR